MYKTDEETGNIGDFCITWHLLVVTVCCTVDDAEYRAFSLRHLCLLFCLLQKYCDCFSGEFVTRILLIFISSSREVHSASYIVSIADWIQCGLLAFFVITFTACLS